jgi:hypothetical protein
MLPVLLIGIVITFFLHSLPVHSETSVVVPKTPKLFLYASDLPIKLKNQYYVFRKHVVDVVLATQLYNLVFSQIPEYLVKSEEPQFILKYKFRTDGESTYRIELFLIDVDIVQIVREIKWEKIEIEELLYQFRFGLYEFILDKNLRPNEKRKFLKETDKKIKEIASQRLDKRSPPPPRKITIIEKTNKKIVRKNKKKLEKKGSGKIAPSKRAHGKKQKASLWVLLRDQDKDIPWIVVSEQAQTNDQSEQNEEGLAPDRKKISNPFVMWGKISQKDKKELRTNLQTNQFHLAWKYVQRDVFVKDLVKIRSEFYSLFGVTIEWLYFLPIHLSKLVFRTGIELDQTFNTTPIKLAEHFLLRTGFGYRLYNWLMPSLYYEHSDLNYANLNIIGDGIEANHHSVKWLTMEFAILGNQLYSSIHFSKSISSSRNRDKREASSPSGTRYGANVRYFFLNKTIGIRPWCDIEFRRESFKRENYNNTMTIYKNEYSTRLGVHF